MSTNSAAIEKATHATLIFEREILAPVGDVFAAYADTSVRVKWSAPSDDIILYDHEEFREGCHDRFRCGPKANPNIHGTTHYWEIVLNQRIVSTEVLVMGTARLAVSLNTIEFSEFGSSTKLKHTVQLVSFIGQDMLTGHEHGNNAALNSLAQHFGAKNP